MAKRKQPELFAGDKAAAKRRWRIGEVERRCKRQGLWPIIGTDEVGRGPLAGPVVAAAVVLEDGARLKGLDDSKLLTEASREALVPKIEAQALAWSVVEGPVALIDSVNILQASMWAMRQAVEEVWNSLLDAGATMPKLVVVDGNTPIPELVRPGQKTYVKGDQRSRAIAAASILAKVHRDRLMVRMADEHPGYGFAGHKGYPTAEHLAALKKLGPTPHHRSSFAPVRAAIARQTAQTSSQ